MFCSINVAEAHFLVGLLIYIHISLRQQKRQFLPSVGSLRVILLRLSES